MFKQGDKKTWNPGVDKIFNWPVKIVGIASLGSPILGITYIAELLTPIPGYGFTHVAAFECHLTDLIPDFIV
jgi:hypothetical protein